MKRLLKVLLVLIAFACMGAGAVVGVVLWIRSDLPEINSLADYRPPMNSRILAKDGTLLLDIGKETRDVVPYKDIPPRVVGAFLAAEDDNFWNHKGVDYLGIARAFLVNLREGRLVQGGSTITQQVAKTLLLSKERTLSRKIKDLLLAQKMEEKFSKEDILFLYLNQVYLGGGYYGVKAAIAGYFDKELAEASVAESALIAGLLVAPGRYSPYVNPTYAKRRQLYVLRRMYETGKITEEEYEAAKKEDIKMRLRFATPMRGGHFTDWVRQKMTKLVGDEEFLTEGFEVVTTLDWSLQEKAEAAVLKSVKELDKRQGYKGPQSHLDTEEAIAQELERQRQKIYRDSSTYFFFTVDGKQRFQNFSESGEWEKLTAYFREAEEAIAARFRADVVVGNTAEDRILPLLQKDQSYSAVVLRVNDAQRTIFASIGGARVVIPESGFAWAHERVLNEEPKWFAPVTKPSKILRPGDQILVRISGEAQSVWPRLAEDYKKSKKDPVLIKLLQEQKFLIGELDQKPDAEGAFVSMDVRTGNVLAMVGGVDFTRSQFNRALQAARQPGSAFKPFIYAAALEEGYTPSSTLLDTPQALGGVSNNLSWKPRNYDGEFMGQMTFRRALEVSRNIPTIRILQDIGVPQVTTFVERLGLKTQLPKDMSLALGSFGISLTELVKGYAIFANGGRRQPLTAILSVRDRNGKKYSFDGEMKTELVSPSPDVVPGDPEPREAPLVENPWKQGLSDRQVYDPRLSYVMTKLLEGVVLYGTAAAAREVSPNLAGKTGTTNNYVDALFIGYSSSIVAGAWIGFDNNTPLGYGETGGKTALPVWVDFMREAGKKYEAVEFSVPDGITNILINKETGRQLRPGETSGFMESFAQGMDLSGEVSRPVNPSGNGEEAKDSPKVLDDDDYYSNQ